MKRNIYSKRMASYLIEQGFRIEEIKTNPFKPRFKMWVFKDTEALRKAMSEFK